ncbi:hypothetical protein [Nitratifractor sp.]
MDEVPAAAAYIEEGVKIDGLESQEIVGVETGSRLFDPQQILETFA